jgi:hypothetical protein
MQLPEHIVTELKERRALRHAPASAANPDAVAVHASLGLTACISPEGDVFLETFELSGDTPPQIDRSRRGQLLTLALGSRSIPALRELLPRKTPGAPTCEKCEGEGWVFNGAVICEECCGLGWTGPG